MPRPLPQAAPPEKCAQIYPVPSVYRSVLLGKTHLCWICRRRLSEFGGDASLKQHFHHCIPRAFGGADGPVVSLDSGHHTLLHDVGLRLISGKDYDDLLEGVPDDWSSRVMYLATRVAIAHSYSKDDPNKRTQVHLSLNKVDADKLREIVKFHKTSQEVLLTTLLRSEHKRLFPSLAKS